MRRWNKHEDTLIINKSIVDSKINSFLVLHSDEIDRRNNAAGASDVQVVPPPGELLLNITSCFILAQWPHGMKT